MSKEGLLICGWCMTGHHEGCKPKITYHDKTWKCLCKICNGTIESKNTEEGKNDQD